MLTGWVAGLNRECVNEQVHVDDIALCAVGIGQLVGRESVRVHERSINLVKHVRPDLPNRYSNTLLYNFESEEVQLTMYFVGGLQALVRQGIGGLGHGIRELSDAGHVVVKDVSSHNIVQGIFRDLIHPPERYVE